VIGVTALARALRQSGLGSGSKSPIVFKTKQEGQSPILPAVTKVDPLEYGNNGMDDYLFGGC
jgi:hypothetical protein